LAVALALPLAPALPGHALTGPSTAIIIALNAKLVFDFVRG
jgi:hypothetical protein